ncbi:MULTISPECIES: AAA family ATPase [Carboxydocella]|uniref:CO dehydrogenase maturation factor n=2 Tax=Carboxydocella TaxID=178898 RepID=A0A1T4S2V0_9FIRM|nr:MULTISPECIES: AAA family ATPase [Carboxydocella]AVX20657.1 CO dehydrogenase maturation factor [Carboxydocella thermautotrophica]AVX31079.1 CO dehydrogenase maturation factor [Carboxydocella thermautotrophica]GAW27978.1 carbon monoxide dehydrogenase maturation factor [Carboxydocella sp. ULO1]SKA22640.1 CO dehydrogenase maturation factor [Carboxydocella sporoproducens DSM 16521]
MKIAVAGKGGVGKTTFTALLIKQLVEANKGAILAVDADPNSNLNEALGIEVHASIADILDEVKGGKAIPEGMPKDVYVEYRLSQVLNETDYVDLVVMGVPQGSGCYCYPNDLMRKYLENLRQNYDYVVIDNEAGMEHLARRVVTDIDYLFVVSDASARGIRSAGRVFDIVKTVGINVKNIYLVITKVLPTGIEELKPEIEATGLEVVGTIPYDEVVARYDLAGKPLVELPADSPSVLAVKNIFSKLAL